MPNSMEYYDKLADLEFELFSLQKLTRIGSNPEIDEMINKLQSDIESIKTYHTFVNKAVIIDQKPEPFDPDEQTVVVSDPKPVENKISYALATTGGIITGLAIIAGGIIMS